MPSFSHEGFIDLFRQRPILAAELLTRALGVQLPAYSNAETTEADFTQLVPTEFRSDLVILLKDGRPVFGIVDDEHGMVYYDLIMAALGEATRQELQEMARSGNYEFVSDFAKKHIAQGRAEALVQVLKLRGFAVDNPPRQRISQASIERLEAWLAKAVTANALTDVFQDG